MADIRRLLFRISDDAFVPVVKLFATGDYCAPDVLAELARTPAFRKRMQAAGFIPSASDEPGQQYRPTRSRQVLKKCGIELPKAPPGPLPSVVRIGPWRRDGREIRMGREELFELVWSRPVSHIAEEWGISDRGLSKACTKLKIPVPPRGYWAKKQAGRRVRRARIPELPKGEAEEIRISLKSHGVDGAVD